MQEAVKSDPERIVSNIKDFLGSLNSVIFAYIFGSFAKRSVFADIDIGVSTLFSLSGDKGRDLGQRRGSGPEKRF